MLRPITLLVWSRIEGLSASALEVKKKIKPRCESGNPREAEEEKEEEAKAAGSL